MGANSDSRILLTTACRMELGVQLVAQKGTFLSMCACSRKQNVPCAMLSSDSKAVFIAI